MGTPRTHPSTRRAGALPALPAPAALLLPLFSLLSLVSLVFLAGCGEADAGAARAERVDSAGVEIVTSPAEDRAIRASLAAEFRLGGKDDDAESFYEVNGYGVAVSTGGLIAVLDQDNHRVVVFDGDGGHVRTVGREGDGPGELGWPVGLFWTADGEIMVQDISKPTLVGYDAAGEPVDGARLPDEFRGGRVSASGDDYLLVVRSFDPAAERLIRWSGPADSTTLASASQESAGQIQLESCGMGFSGMPVLFSTTLRWSAAGGEVAVAHGTGYAVDVYRDGRLVRSVRRDLPARPATLEDAVAEVGDAMRVMTPAGERVCDSEEVAEKRGWAAVIPAVETVAIAPDGTLWVGRWAVGDEARSIDLFDADGVYQGTLPAGTPFPVGFLPDGRVLWTETDDFDVDRLVVGRLAAQDGE